MHFDQRLNDKSRTQVKMNDKSSSLKLKLYLFSSSDAEKQHEHLLRLISRGIKRGAGVSA